MSSQSQSRPQDTGVLNLEESCVFSTSPNCPSLARPSQQAGVAAESRSAWCLALESALMPLGTRAHSRHLCLHHLCITPPQPVGQSSGVPSSPEKLGFLAMPPALRLYHCLGQAPFLSFAIASWCAWMMVLKTASSSHCTSLTSQKHLAKGSYRHLTCFGVTRAQNRQGQSVLRSGAALWLPRASHSRFCPLLFNCLGISDHACCLPHGSSPNAN